MTYLKSMADAQLVRLYQDGNPDGLGTLIIRYKDRIYTSIYMLVKDKYTAEDIFQDVFIRVMTTIQKGKYKDEGKFLPWVLRIAHNLSVDHFRKAKRKPKIKMSDDRDIFEVLNFCEPSVEDEMVTLERHEMVKKMLDTLPKDQQEVIILRHFADLSFKEISELTNTSINTSLGRMRYGLINLRKLIAEQQIVL